MKEKKLYIIGNGFDISHNLPTKYTNFYKYCKYLEKNNNNFFLRDLNDIFPYLDDNEQNWHDFEAQLSNFNIDPTIIDTIQEDCKSLEYNEDVFELIPTMIEPFLEKYHKTISRLHLKFKKWLESIRINTSTPIYKINDKSEFLNFNYTQTLEKLYAIDKERICYVHGRVGDEELIIGHSWEYKIDINPLNNRFIKTPDNEILDTVENKIVTMSELKQIQDCLKTNEDDKRIFYIIKDQIISPLQKNCIDIIADTPFFIELDSKNINNIFVLGHSLSDVDMPYFEYIHEECNDVKWTISYYTDDDLKKISEFKERFNLDENHCKTININDLLK